MPPRARRPAPSPARVPARPAPVAPVAPPPGPPVAPGPTAQDVGRAIRRLRGDAGYAQEGFADHAGLHRTGQSALERGLVDPRLSTLVKIAAGLGLPVSELLREIEREAATPASPHDEP